ncbi:MAG: DUF4296 domain-containing protein [Saprospiraceae bacterium]|nr:DUF4296 domain-containing protein [Saprospiraceae bacterium]
MRALFWAMLFFVIACQDPVLPISEDKMAEVLRDVMIAEAAIQRVGRSTNDTVENLYYEQIYTIHNIDSAKLNLSFQMLQDNPEMSERVYKQAEILLSELDKEN